MQPISGFLSFAGYGRYSQARKAKQWATEPGDSKPNNGGKQQKGRPKAKVPGQITTWQVGSGITRVFEEPKYFVPGLHGDSVEFGAKKKRQGQPPHKNKYAAGSNVQQARREAEQAVAMSAENAQQITSPYSASPPPYYRNGNGLWENTNGRGHSAYVGPTGLGNKPVPEGTIRRPGNGKLQKIKPMPDRDKCVPAKPGINIQPTLSDEEQKIIDFLLERPIAGDKTPWRLIALLAEAPVGTPEDKEISKTCQLLLTNLQITTGDFQLPGEIRKSLVAQNYLSADTSCVGSAISPKVLAMAKTKFQLWKTQNPQAAQVTIDPERQEEVLLKWLQEVDPETGRKDRLVVFLWEASRGKAVSETSYKTNLLNARYAVTDPQTEVITKQLVQQGLLEPRFPVPYDPITPLGCKLYHQAKKAFDGSHPPQKITEPTFYWPDDLV